MSGEGHLIWVQSPEAVLPLLPDRGGALGGGQVQGKPPDEGGDVAAQHVAGWGGHALHEEHLVRGGDQDSGWGGLAPHGRPPDKCEHSLNVPRDTFSDEDFVKFAKKGADFHVIKNTSSGLLELPQQVVSCSCSPEDSVGEDIVEIQNCHLFSFRYSG